MPLRVRLILLIALMLLVSLAGGSLLVGWRAASSVRTELVAALDVGERTVRNGFDNMAHADDQATAVQHLIATFNGNRHVRASLLDRRGRTVVTSIPLQPSEPAPGWFRGLIGSVPDAILLTPPGATSSVIELRADPVNEIAEVWEESRDTVLILSVFASLSALLICVAAGRALRPLETLSTALERIGKDEHVGTVPEHGPAELAQLASSFNLMTRRLAKISAQNRRLNDRLLTLQAQERAELARDLHDEIGPLLFAVDMTAATIEHLSAGGRAADIPAHVRSIHSAVGRMQRHVRLTLERLRPPKTGGLKAAIEQLVMFWRVHRPAIEFAVTVTIDEGRIGDAMKETVYRVVQEGLSNAIRHGAPGRIEITATQDASGGVQVEVTDDGVGLPDPVVAPDSPMQFGLLGMRERVTAMAGSVSIRHGRGGKGFTLAAHLPGTRSMNSRDQEVTE